jgi:hypothetical protein
MSASIVPVIIIDLASCFSLFEHVSLISDKCQYDRCADEKN